MKRFGLLIIGVYVAFFSVSIGAADKIKSIQTWNGKDKIYLQYVFSGKADLLNKVEQVIEKNIVIVPPTKPTKDKLDVSAVQCIRARNNKESRLMYLCLPSQSPAKEIMEAYVSVATTNGAKITDLQLAAATNENPVAFTLECPNEKCWTEGTDPCYPCSIGESGPQFCVHDGYCKDLATILLHYCRIPGQ